MEEPTKRKSRAKPILDPKDFDMAVPQHDIIWLAGILEGEGSFGIDRRAGNRYKNSFALAAPYVRLTMTDKDVVEKFAKIVGKKMFRASKLTQGGKIEYIVSVGKRETLFYLLPKILPFMGQRRAARIQELIDLLNEWREWLLSGGRSKSAAIGGETTARNKKKS